MDEKAVLSAVTSTRGAFRRPVPLIPWLTAAVVIAADQFTKALVEASLGAGAERHEIRLVGDWFTLRYGRNTGAAFGLFQGESVILSIVSVAVVVGLFAVSRRASTSRRMLFAVALLAGGAIGNLIDRVRLGYVTDFIHVGRWPTFNIADSAITIAIVLLLVSALFGESDSRAPTEQEPAR